MESTKWQSIRLKIEGTFKSENHQLHGSMEEQPCFIGMDFDRTECKETFLSLVKDDVFDWIQGYDGFKIYIVVAVAFGDTDNMATVSRKILKEMNHFYYYFVLLSVQ